MQCYGVETDRPSLKLPGFAEQLAKLKQTDSFLYDRTRRPRFGDVVSATKRKEVIEPELNRRKMTLAGVVDLGASFGIDGNIFVSHANFLRLFPNRKSGSIDIGVVKLNPGVSIAAAQKQFQNMLGKEVNVLTREQYQEVELQYWRAATPIGIIFSAGTAVGFFIGFIVVYQILYTEVSNHLPHFATMKTMGFSNGYLYQVVLGQSFQLALMGLIPGTAVAAAMYFVLRKLTQLPLVVDPWRGLALVVVTILMCMISGMLAIRKLASADPADVF